MSEGLTEINAVLMKSRKILKRADQEKHLEQVVNSLETGAFSANQKENHFDRTLS